AAEHHLTHNLLIGPRSDRPLRQGPRAAAPKVQAAAAGLAFPSFAFATISVRFPGTDSTKSSPPNILSRSRMLAKPIPACAAAGSKPTPKSLTFRTIVSTVLNYIVQRFLRDTVNAECQVGWHVFRQLRDIEGYWNT